MEHQRQPERGAHGLLGQIVIGGAKAPGGEDHVRAAAGDVHGLGKARGVVAYYRVPVDVDAHGGQGL